MRKLTAAELQGEIPEANPLDVGVSSSVERTNQRFRILTDHAGDLPTEVRWQLAGTDTPDAELLRVAEQTIDYGNLNLRIQSMNELPSTVQESLWKQMTSGNQKILLDAGYKSPEMKAREDEDKSWWQYPVDAVLGVGRVPWRSAEMGLQYMAAAGEAVAGHPYRMMGDLGGDAETGRRENQMTEAIDRLRQRGVTLTEDQENVLKGRFLDQNRLSVTTRGEAVNDDTARDRYIDYGKNLLPGFMRTGLDALDMAARIEPLADAVDGVPVLGSVTSEIAERTQDYNPYESFLGGQVDDDTYAQFRDEMFRMDSDPDYEMSLSAAWGRTGNGQSYIQPWDEAKLRDELGDRSVEARDLALWRAQDRSLEEWITDQEHITTDDPRFGDRYMQLKQAYETDATWMKVVEDLQKDQSKISFGRDYARTIGIAEDSSLFPFVSGLGDAAHVLVFDPTLVAGRGLKVARAAKALRSFDELAAVNHFGRVAQGKTLLDEVVPAGSKQFDRFRELEEAVNHVDLKPIVREVFGEDAPRTLQLIDDNGMATELLASRYDDVLDVVNKGQQQAIARGVVDSGQNLDLAEELGHLRGVLTRTTFTGERSGLRALKLKAQLREGRQFRDLMDRVADAFIAANEGGDQAGLKLGQLYRDLPHGQHLLNTMKQLNEVKRITSADDVADLFINNKALFVDMAKGEMTGTLVRGFGHGMHIPDRMRLFGNLTDDLPQYLRSTAATADDAVERNELFNFPKLTTGTKINRDIVNALEDTMAHFATWGVGSDNIGLRMASKVTRPAASLAFGLTHQVPKGATLALDGPEGIVQFEQLLNFGHFAGMDRAVRDDLLGRWIAGQSTGEILRYAGDDLTVLPDRLVINRLVEGNDKIAQAFVSEFGGTELLQRTGIGQGQPTIHLNDRYDDILGWIDQNVEQFPELARTKEALGRFSHQFDDRFINVGARVNVLKAGLRQMFDAGGIYTHDAGRQWADAFIEKMDTGRYAIDGQDLFQLGSAQSRVGIYPVAHHSMQVMLPQFDEFLTQSRKLGVLNYGLRKLNNPVVDAFMGQVWKPSILLRLGFIPRAAGEEALAYVARQGGEAIRSYLAAKVLSEGKGVALAPPTSALRAASRSRLANRHGVIYAALKEQNKLKLEEAARLGLKAEMDAIWEMSHIAKFERFNDYLVDSAQLVGRSMDEVSKLDHFTLWADYMAAKVLRSWRRFEFEMLPESLRDGVIFHAAARHGAKPNTLIRAMGLQLSETMQGYTMRAPAIQRAAAEEVATIGTTAAESPHGPSVVATVRAGRGKHDTNPKHLQLTESHNFTQMSLSNNPIEALRVMDHDFGVRAADPTVRAGLEKGLAGTIPESVLVDELGPILRGTPFAPGTPDLSVRVVPADAVVDDVAQEGVEAVPRVGNVDETTGEVVTPRSDVNDLPVDEPAPNPVAVIEARVSEAQQNLDALERLRLRIERTWNTKDRTLTRQYLQDEHLPGQADLPVGDDKWVEKFDQYLLPATRTAVARSRPGSAIEQLARNAIHHAEQVPGSTRLAELEILMKMRKRWAQTLVGDTPLRAFDEGLAREAVRQGVRDTLQLREVDRFTRGMIRTTAVDGVPVRNAPGANVRHLYPVFVDRPTSDFITRLDEPARLAIADELGDALDPEQRDNLLHLLANWDSQLANAYTSNQKMISNGGMVPFGNLVFQSEDEARRFADILQTWTPGGTYDGIRSTDVGWTRVPDTSPLLMVDGGRPWRPDEMKPNLAQISEGHLFEAEPFGNVPVQRFDEYGMVSPDGVNAAPGVTYEAAVDDLAETITDVVLSSYRHPATGEPMHELIGPTVRNTWDAKVVHSVPLSELPQEIIGPNILAVNPDTTWQRIVRTGFDDVINPAISALVRNPMSVLSIGDASAAMKPVRLALRNTELFADGERALANLGATLPDLRAVWYQIDEPVRIQITNGEDLLLVLKRYNDVGHPLGQNALAQKILGEANNEIPGLLTRMARNDHFVESTIDDAILNRWVDDVIPFIDNHEVRSFFQVYARNIMPFQFAQEAFLKRWAKTAIYSPEAFRRAQLIAHGFTQSVFVEQDENGEDVWVIPASEALGNQIAKIPFLFGGKASIPVSVPFTGQVKTMLPGIPGDLYNLPPLSPIAQIPAGTLTGIFPELRPVGDPFTQGRGFDRSRSVLEQIMPATAARVIASVTGGPFGEKEMTSNAIGAMQLMASEAIRLRADGQRAISEGRMEDADGLFARAEELDPSADAPARVREQYIDNVKHWSRSMMMTKAIIGFASPSSPSARFEGAKLSTEFSELLEHMEFSEALGVFLAENPNAGPYVIGENKKDTEARPATTEAALKYAENNRDLLATYDQAGPWLMPQSDAGDQFSQAAWNDQVATELRYLKSPEEWYDDFKFASAAAIYFPAKARFDAEVEAIANDKQRQLVRQQWDEWAGQFKEQHPVFTEQLTGEGRTRKISAIRQLGLALQDPNVPDPGHHAEMRTFTESYLAYDALVQQLKYDNSSLGRRRKEELREEFLTWGEQAITRSPRMRSLWNGLILPATGLRSEDQKRKA